MYPLNENVDARDSVPHDCWPGLACGYSAGRFGRSRTSARESRVNASICAGVYANESSVFPLILHGTMSRFGPYFPLS